MEDLTRRAYSAYFRTGDNVDQPSEAHSGPVEHDGKEYVVLRDSSRVLAVYRVRPAGQLKRLKRWPAELEEI